MRYTVKELASLAGVSVRTLHYYDEIGLLRPSQVNENGYRFYEEPELLRLQQILFFRELDFSLRDIREMLDSPNFDQAKALRDHRRLIQKRQTRLTHLVSTIDTTLQKIEQGVYMDDQQLFDPFVEKLYEPYREEVRAQYDPKLVKQSEDRMRKMSKQDMQDILDNGDRVVRAIVEHMPEGPTSPEVQKLMGEYFDHICNFYDCTLEIFRKLGEVYVEDARFRKSFTQYHPELADFMNEAMKYYCDQRE